MSQNPTSNPKSEEKTHFGFDEVSLSEKTQKVLGVFHSVAQKYDLMNDLMSGGMHRLWKTQFVKMLDMRPGMSVLDMAGGTGDIAFKIYEATKHFNDKVKITICDINQSMLNVGQDRAIDRGILSGLNFSCADAAVLGFEDESFDRYTISFGIRNVTEIEKALAEAYRVLKPGGRFQCMEFSKVSIPLLKKAYKSYSFKLIPWVGEKVTGDRESYQYLVESIEQFPSQEDFKSMIEYQLQHHRYLEVDQLRYIQYLHSSNNRG